MCALRTTRPDVGGIWGTSPWGGRYYAGHIQAPSTLRTTRPDCGGIWATGAWGMRFYGGHIQCGYVPPIPPVPPTPDDRFVGGSGRRKKRILREDDRLIRREKPIVFQRADESGDEEDIELILAMWLNLK
jgi:hypothetical protein